MNIEPTGQILGATITNLNLSEPLSKSDFATLLRALAEHSVLRFPDQRLSATALRDLAQRFGTLQTGVTGKAIEPGIPEVSILSNIVRNGVPIGIPDAGQSWHTDMTYNRTPGYINALVAYEVPVRDGVTLGSTEFTNTAAAYDDLSDELKSSLADSTALHDLNLYWEYMRREKGSSRAALTEEERKKRPPARHPVFLTHPVSGRKIIFVNPGYCVAVEGMPPGEGERMMQTLLDHVLQPKYRYRHHWEVNDMLIWDHLGTWHTAIADYGPNESRLMKRCQVLADRIFDPDFVRDALAA